MRASLNITTLPRRRRWLDFLTRAVMALGAAAVAAVIVLMLIFLVQVTAPLFLPAAIAPSTELSLPAGQAKLLRIDRSGEAALRVDADGRISIFAPRDGAQLQSRRLDASVVAAKPVFLADGLHAVLDSAQRLWLLQVVPRLRLRDGARRLHDAEINILFGGRPIPVGAVIDYDLAQQADADCILPATWVEGLAAYFAADPGGAVGAVFGQLAVRSRPPRRGGFLERYQAFEQPLVHQYSTGSAGLGTPTGCFGNNLALRAPVLARIGGFRSLGYTLTEDAALIGAAHRGGWRVRAATLLATQITTAPQPSWGGFINQHVRWNGGAFFSSDRAAAWGYRYVTLFLIASVAAAPAALLAPWLAVLPCTSLLSIGTLAALEALLYHRRRGRALARVIPYTLFFMGFYAYITVLAIAGVRTDWKGSRLAATRAPVAPNADLGAG